MHTPFELSRLALGTMTFGDTVEAETAGRMLDLALEAGVTMIDTANGYAGGATESMLGSLLPSRRGFVLATKAGIPHPDAERLPPLSPEAVRLSVEGSLKRLGVERVDLFYLHQPDRSTPLRETLTAVGELVTEGKIGALGVSNYAAWHVGAVNAAADEVGTPRPVVAQQLYNLLARRIEDEYTDFASASGIATMVYNPLGGGLLSGRHTFGQRPAEGRFGDSRLAAMYTERYWNAELFEAIADLGAVAEQAGLALPELALRWLLSRDVVDSVLLGGSKVAQLEANLAAAAKGPLPEDVVVACEAIGTRLHGPMPAYAR
ncbi:aldo/keto reductase [Kineosporia succinea]|uniref:Aryl-alcohol dehydrogenase-like predicted oxidoreductase n=1 Tax=Kineosporia succinea TaxID=84632 RepID=A0ABT9P8E2_9ACTN|nr:aldo/keto reductase [Kineosporia succinea]MDP9828953.1 aryl-alcohol dehydrogenase-like predicted oxidoreductase [Kineosporia succinea]